MVLSSATIVGALRSVFTYFTGPRLHVYFNAQKTYHIHHATIFEGKGDSLGYFCHVIVRNGGRETAKQCRGRLAGLRPIGDESRFPRFGAPEVLRWAYERNFNPCDIQPKMNHRLDLCCALEALPNHLIIETPGARTLLPQGIYLMKVRVDAENAKHAEGAFRVEFTGAWNEIRVTEDRANME